MRQEKPAILGGTPVFSQPLQFARPFLPSLEELLPFYGEIFASGQITNGKYVAELEKKAAEYLGVKHCVAVSSATSGLVLTEQALGLAGEVIVPSFTFCATAHSLLWNGLKPVFVDCDGQTFNIDPDRAEGAITEKTSAILAVHIFGNPSAVRELEKVAEAHQLKLIFDAAHALGACYQDQPIGGFGDAEVFSLSPTKLVVAGEGGLVATNNGEVAEKIRLTRNYGSPSNYNCHVAGLNARLSEFHAVLAIKSLEALESAVAKRNKVATQYQQSLNDLLGLSWQKIEDGNRCAYKDLGLLISEGEFGLSRDQLSQALGAENISFKKYFYPPLHQQSVYQAGLKQKVSLPVTEEISRNIINLPIHSYVNSEQVERVAAAIRRIHKFSSEIRQELK